MTAPALLISTMPGFPDGWALFLILAVIVALLGLWKFSGIFQGFNRGKKERPKDTADAQDNFAATMKLSPEDKPTRRSHPNRDDFILWIAQGFDIGRIPVAPGTFGSIIGIIWFFLLLSTECYWLFLAGTAAGFFLSVWLCGAAEKTLRQTDPPSVVLDEITALPVCFLAWVTAEFMRRGAMPGLETFLGGRNWIVTLIIFGLFRLFDIAKPWPVRQSQRLPGGWGVTVDDFLAALYVALATGIFLLA